ncbi:hypothetical protein GGI12_000715 [Dipsacomyces acuminosporus]|nr:hypothetical protein GGI12_000715 [Dipsacomyces acuminosporus]
MSASTTEKKKLTLWEKAFTRDEDWQKEELREAVFWLIAAFSVTFGLVCGVLGLRGLPCFIFFFTGAVALPSVYTANFLGLDDEDFGGKMEILGDSIGACLSMFLISWPDTSTMSDEIRISLVDYASGLGVPGIMPPKLRSTIDIVGTPSGAKVTKREFDGHRQEAGVYTGDLADDSLIAVFALVEELQSLPQRDAPGGPDVFGQNTTILVRQGRNVIWGYNPGSGCGGYTDEEDQFSITSDDKSKFANIVSGLKDASDATVKK